MRLKVVMEQVHPREALRKQLVLWEWASRRPLG